MAYVKYSPQQIAERERAQKAIVAAKAHLKSIRDAKKANKDRVMGLRRALKAEIRRRKEAAIAAKKAERELKDLKKKCRPLLAVLRKVYKPYMVARRKVERLKKAKAKAALLEDRKAAKEAVQAAKEQLKLNAAKEQVAKAADTRSEEKPKSPKKQFKIKKRPSPIQTELSVVIDTINTTV